MPLPRQRLETETPHSPISLIEPAYGSRGRAIIG